MTDTASLTRRLDRLELENRRLRRFSGLSLATIFAWAACSVAQPAGETIQASRFVLVDGSGAEQGALELDPNGLPVLQLQHGPRKAILSLDGPGLLLRGAQGKTTAYMGIDSRGSSRVELTSERLMDGLRLATHEDGTTGLYLLDITGRERAGLEAASTGGASLAFKGPTGRSRLQVGVDLNELPSVLLMDGQGTRRAGAAVLQDGNPMIEVQDEKGRPRVQLTTLFDGTPSLDFFREDGGTSFRAP